MRFRLLRRRLTISAPRMAVRSAMPWPLRWVVVALVLGFCASVALWAFEFGKDIAGLEPNAKEELVKLRAELVQVRQQRDDAQSIVNTSGSLLTAEKAAQQRLSSQIRQLEADNQALRDDLGFFEKLLPTAGGDAVAIRGLQAELLSGSQMKWQVLVIQSVRNAPEFSGKLELSVTGLQNGKPWNAIMPGSPVPLQLKQYRRLEGVLDLPPQTVVKTVTARILEGSLTRTVQTVKL